VNRIVVIEDEVDLGRLYRFALERRGYEVLGPFDDPREALAVGGEVGVVILDERLGGLSGSAFLPEIRRTFPAARILLATADPGVAARARALGADLAKEKPFSIRDLVDAVVGLSPLDDPPGR